MRGPPAIVPGELVEFTESFHADALKGLGEKMTPLERWQAATAENNRIHRRNLRRLKWRGRLMVAAIVGVVPVGVVAGIVWELLTK